MTRKRKSKETKKDESPKMNFASFFQRSVTRKLVKPWQEKEIWAHFKRLGLSPHETSDTYLDALAKY